jgi:hypothetical protein
VIVAPLSVLLRRLSGGRWSTQYCVSALLLLLTSSYYRRTLTVDRSARSMLAEQQEQQWQGSSDA